MLKLTCAAAVLAVAGLAAGGAASAADYPEKRIEWLVGFSAGGGTDLVSRRIAQGMEEQLGEDLTIVNKPGAGGLVALQEAAAAPADGYTLATFVTNNMLIQKHYKDIVNYVDPQESLTIISIVNMDYWAIAVPAGAPYDTLPEFVAHLEGNSGAKVSDGGPGSAYHWGWRTFEEVTGADVETVTYPGTAAALKALAGGELTAASTALAEAGPLVEAGLIKLLGVAAPDRYESFPEVPTFKEQGVDMVYGPSRGIAGPAGLPADVVATLASAIDESFHSEGYQEFLSESGYRGLYMGPDEAQAFVEEEGDRLRRVMERIGVAREQ